MLPERPIVRMLAALCGMVVVASWAVLAQPAGRTARSVKSSRPAEIPAGPANRSTNNPVSPPGLVFVSQTVDLSEQLSSDETIFSLDGEPVPHFQTTVLTIGIVIDPEGYVVTRLANIPKVDSTDRITVLGSNSGQRQYQARFIGVDSVTGIGVIKIDDPAFKAVINPAVAAAPQTTLRQAQMLGFHPRQSLGRPGVTMLRPRLFNSPVQLRKAIDDFRYSNANPFYELTSSTPLTAIQDCSVIVDPVGSIFGLVAYDTSGEGRHVVYPIARVRKLASLIIQDCVLAKRNIVPHAWLGATGNPAILTARPGNQLPAEERGIQIAAVFPDSPAEIAGMEPSDVLLSISGRVISTGRDLRDTLQMLPADSEVTLTVRRKRQVRNLLARLVPAPALDSKQQAKWILSQVEEYERSARKLPEKDPKRDQIEKKRDTMVSIMNQLFTAAPPEIHLNIRYGLEVLPLTAQLAHHFSAPGGVVVSKVNAFGKGHLAGLAAGDVIVKVGEQPVADAASFFQAINNETHEPMELFVLRQGQQVKINLSK